MIHLVHFWLKEEYNTPELREKFEQSLAELCKCPLASKSSWGRPAKVKERPVLEISWDYNLVTYFDSVQVHDEYQVCPVHVKFIEDCKHLWEKVLVIDSELED